MTKKIDDDILAELEEKDAPVPFFAHLLSRHAPPTKPGSLQTSCLTDDCTKKYPSDGDEPTSPTWDKPGQY
jgi:hypothetical protein